jgi:hypothetical protein
MAEPKSWWYVAHLRRNGRLYTTATWPQATNRFVLFDGSQYGYRLSSFPMRWYPTVESLPTKRTEIDLWN